MFLLNLFLAGSWVALTGDASIANSLTGFAIGFGVLWVANRSDQSTPYFARFGNTIRLFFFFVWELVVATLRVAIDILTPRHRMRPAILAVPVEVESPAELTLLANIVTLTPGTLILDVSPDQKTIYVHSMYANDIDESRQSIRNGLASLVRKVFK